MAESATDIRAALMQSRKFRQWKKGGSKTFGEGKEFNYTGKIFKNLAKASERHFTVAEISSMWGVSEDLVRDIFRDESGVLRIRRPATKMKRGYSTLRVPESTLDRVYSELSNEDPNVESLATPHKKVPTPR